MKTKFALHIAQFLLVACTTFYIPHGIAGGIVKGQVEFIRMHDTKQHPSWISPRFWFTLKGLTNAGACPRWTNNKIVFVANEDAMLDLVLKAMGSNLEIAVAYDDITLTNGQCTVSFITLGYPAPLY